MKGEHNTMYNYTLSNNHYIINIEGNNYLLDTGSPVSFSLKPGLNSVIINQRRYSLPYNVMNLDIEATRELVGMDVDGFIGMDIIRQTSLTIYKDGRIEFRALPEQGNRLEMLADPYGLIKLKVSSNDYVSAYLVDTGARYAYGREYLFGGSQPFGHIKDYNPRLGHFESDIYHIPVDFGPIQKTLDIADSVEVRGDLRATGSLIVGNITDLFDEVCVIDMHNRVVTLK